MRYLNSSIIAAVVVLCQLVPASGQIVVNLATRDLAYDPLNNTIYASVPGSSATNPNSLTPINPNSGALGTPLALNDPRRVVVSDDGQYVYATYNDNHSVQRYNVVADSLDLNFTMPGTGQFFQKVREMYAIPGQPTSVLIARNLPNFSPP